MSAIYVAALGAVPETVVEETVRCLRETIGEPVTALPFLPEPAGAFDPVRQQYSAAEFLRVLVKNGRAGCKLVGLTERDLFIPMLTFLFGQAQLGGMAALVSAARLRAEFYGLPPDPETFQLRLRKEVLHETGHAFGLVHCPERLCAMSLSTSIQQVDAKRDQYCAGCARAVDEKWIAFLRSTHEDELANTRGR